MSVKQTIIDRNFTRIMTDIEPLKHLFVKVGYPADGNVGQPSKDGSEHDPLDTMSEVITVAAVHEFGAPNKNIPERAHVRPALDENFEAIQKFKALQVGMVIDGKRSAEDAIKAVGEKHVGQMQAKIRRGPFIPLSQKTIDKKHSSKPLIDTAQTINSVQYQVVNVRPE